MQKNDQVAVIPIENMIFVSSPYGGDDKNRAFAEAVCHKMIFDGYDPWAPHAYYTRFMNEEDPEQRALGIELGLKKMPLCKEVWIFVHEGITEGMRIEEARAIELKKPIRRLDWSILF